MNPADIPAASPGVTWNSQPVDCNSSADKMIAILEGFGGLHELLVAFAMQTLGLKISPTGLLVQVS